LKGLNGGFCVLSLVTAVQGRMGNLPPIDEINRDLRNLAKKARELREELKRSRTHAPDRASAKDSSSRPAIPPKSKRQL
jgi:hypothetical protein